MILTIALWLVVTLAHVALTVRTVSRIWPAAVATLDERLFASVLGTIGSLSIVLHIAAMTTGLGLVSGAVALAIWHLAVWRVVCPRFGAGTAGRAPKDSTFTWPERLASALLLAILLTWVGLAAASSDVLGPDAAHYHVPYAVNLAAGASPFSLPATPHLYPMAASVIGAWFIVPTGDPLIVDLALALPFALLIASLNVLFRCCTGRSGLAWASWLGLALFATPMFRATAQGSADLWFAAAFVALIAGIVRAWSIGRWSAPDLLLAGMAAGLLLGSKTTGAPAVVLVLAGAALVSLIRLAAGGTRVAWPRRTPVILAGATLACLGAGGIWLVRNWVQFGSPLAPAGLSIAGLTIFPGETFQQTTYLSVLGEMQTDSFHLLPRMRVFVDQWFGTWYAPALWPIVILAGDLVLSARRRATLAGWWPRLGLFAITVVAGAALIWLLIGAPWTALDRSHGLTLRYILPIAALLPLLSFIGCFPFSADWYARKTMRAFAATALGAGTVWLWWHALEHPDPTQPSAFAPGIHAIWFVIAAILTTLVPARAGRRLALAAVMAIAIIWWAPMIGRADGRARDAARVTLAGEEAAFAAGQPTTDIWRRAYLALRAAERDGGISCGRRRFFALTRFDEPLALQPPAFGSEVFYAGRDIGAAGGAGPIGACDYIITTPALQLTDKGQTLAEALASGGAGGVAGGPATARVFAATPDLVILAKVPR